jgi:hypothetical protein
MKTPPDSDPATLSRQLEKNARRYAQNRTLPWLVVAAWTMLTIACFCGGFGLAGYGYSEGPFWLAGLGVILALVGLASMVWGDPLIGFGGIRTVWEWGARLNRADGYVSQAPPWEPQPRKLRQVLIVTAWVVVWDVFLFGHNFLVQRGTLALHWTLPLSVLYMVPFLLLSYYVFYRDKGPWFLLSPVLYVLYALLAMLGLPVAFSQRPVVMVASAALIAMFAAAVIGQLYSRLALSKLRRTARMAPHAEEG